MGHRVLNLLLVVGLAAAAIPQATAGPSLPSKLDPGVLDGPSPRAIVLFEHPVGASTIDRLSQAGIRKAAVFEAINAVAVEGPRSNYIEIARWKDVIAVDADDPINFFNYVTKTDTNVDDVRRGSAPLKAGYDGKGVTVAVVDSGVDSSHPDLANVKVHVNMQPAWFMDDITDGEYSDSYAEQPIGTDEQGHGTAVAGVVGASGSKGANTDLSGVAPGATLVNLKVTGPGSTFVSIESNALAAYDWILEHRNDKRFPGGIRVATNSWGIPLEPGSPLERMIKKVVIKGITIVWAAGNSGPDPDTVRPYPGAIEEVITVGAICKSNNSGGSDCAPREVAFISSRGPEIDVVAPGVSVWSTRARGLFGVTSHREPTDPHPGDPDPLARLSNIAWYMPGTGTSFAAPHVAGIVALMLDANPRLLPFQIERIITSTAHDAGAKGFDEDYGYGIVDAFSAVKRAERDLKR